MSVAILKAEIKEVEYTKAFENPWDPIKYDILEIYQLLRVLPQLSQRLNSIEEHLATGKPFVRAAERPQVGAEALESAELVRTLTKRVDELESRLSHGQKG